MVPSIILSGFATPIANMPPLVQDLTWINPMRFALVVIRRCFLEQPSFASLLTPYAAMAILAALSLTAAAWMFRKRSV
jgi:ABC-2 type transport system permease protein